MFEFTIHEGDIELTVQGRFDEGEFETHHVLHNGQDIHILLTDGFIRFTEQHAKALAAEKVQEAIIERALDNWRRLK